MAGKEMRGGISNSLGWMAVVPSSHRILDAWMDQ